MMAILLKMGKEAELPVCAYSWFLQKGRLVGLAYCSRIELIGLPDHDAQLITLNNCSLPLSNTKPSYIRNINKNTIAEFQLRLSWEQWDNIFGNNNVSDMFNTFLST